MRFDNTPKQLEILREIVNNLADPVFLVDKAFNIWFSNPPFDAAVGVRAKSKRFRDKPCYEILGLEICKTDCVMKQATTSDRAVRLAEITGRTAGGENKHFHVNAIPLTNSSGSTFGALIILRDMSAEAAIHEKYKRLVRKNAAVMLSGKLEGGNLPDVIQLVSFLQKTGILSIVSEQNIGSIVFESGQILSVVSGQATLEKALGRMMLWQSGEFSFTPRDRVDVAERYEGNPDFLIMDAVRELDEANAQRDCLPPPTAKLKALRVADEAVDDLDELQWKLYELAIGAMLMGDALDLVSESDVKASLAVLEMRRLGLLTWE